MRMSLAAVTVVAVAVAVAGAAVAAGAGSSAMPASHSSTVRVVIRPVTHAGSASTGYTVHGEQNGAVDCSYHDPSPGAVDRNIEFCSPSVEYAVACWNSTAPHHVVCMRDPTAKQLVKLPRMGRFAHTKLARHAQRAPLLLMLRDGTRCFIRDGGAWSSLNSHPRWFGTYTCTHHGVVWSPPNAHHLGVNESTSSWTVRTASASGHGQLVTRHIKRAYFVGTATG